MGANFHVNVRNKWKMEDRVVVIKTCVAFHSVIVGFHLVILVLGICPRLFRIQMTAVSILIIDVKKGRVQAPAPRICMVIHLYGYRKRMI